MINSEDEAREFVSARGDAQAIARLDFLVSELTDENKRQNLVATATLSHAWQRHIADSAQLLDFAGVQWTTWLDLGSGAGFPGLVIAILRPDYEVTLVESRRKRIDWLARMIDALRLPNCRIEGARAEQITSFQVNVISARAFAPLCRLVTIARCFSTSDTLWLLPKGRSAAQEVAELPTALREMFHVEQSHTDSDAGIVVGQGIKPEESRR